jgi:hypothetical protein
MRHARLVAVVLFLPGCATTPQPDSTSTYVYVTWPEWQPVSVALLELAENNVTPIADELGSVRPFEVPIAVAKPSPLPAPVTPSTNTAPPPEVATEYVDAGKSLTLEVTANGSLPLFYEWRKDHQAIAGATNQRFTIQAVGDVDAGIYVCVVSNSAGGTLSQPIKLVVRKPR